MLNFNQKKKKKVNISFDLRQKTMRWSKIRDKNVILTAFADTWRPNHSHLHLA